MNNDELSKLTAEQLNQLVENGRAVIKPVMTGQWEIVIDDESKGTILTDTFKEEKVISIGEREIGRLTDR